MNTVGARLRYARKCRRFTPRMLRKYCALPVTRLKLWEASIVPIPVDWVEYCAHLYEVPREWLLNGGEAPCAPPAPLTRGEQLMRRCFGEGSQSPERRFNARWRAYRGRLPEPVKEKAK